MTLKDAGISIILLFCLPLPIMLLPTLLWAAFFAAPTYIIAKTITYNDETCYAAATVAGILGFFPGVCWQSLLMSSDAASTFWLWWT